MSAVVRYDPNHACCASKKAIKLQLFKPISLRGDFKKQINVFDINFENQTSKNRNCVKKSRELIQEDDMETRERIQRMESPLEAIHDNYIRRTLKIMEDPAQ